MIHSLSLYSLWSLLKRIEILDGCPMQWPLWLKWLNQGVSHFPFFYHEGTFVILVRLNLSSFWSLSKITHADTPSKVVQKRSILRSVWKWDIIFFLNCPFLSSVLRYHQNLKFWTCALYIYIYIYIYIYKKKKHFYTSSNFSWHLT